MHSLLGNIANLIGDIPPDRLIAIATTIGLFVALLIVYVKSRQQNGQPEDTPSVYQAMTNASNRRRRQAPKTFAQLVEVAPEMAQFRDGFNSIGTSQELMASTATRATSLS